MTDTSKIHAKFDDVLKRHIRRLLDAFPEAASLPFDLATITSLILLVERESEIESFPESAPDRYSESALLEGLVETGIETDDVSKTSVQNLAPMGFITMDAQGEFIPRESTPRLVGVLDNLFPGLPGLNLVAYILQTIDEAKNGRKDLDQALDHFDQTLQTRGVPFSPNREEPQKNPFAGELIEEDEPSSEELAERKNAYLQRLAKMRAQSTTADGSDNPYYEVRSLFNKKPKGPVPQALDTEPEPVPSVPTDAEADAGDNRHESESAGAHADDLQSSSADADSVAATDMAADPPPQAPPENSPPEPNPPSQTAEPPPPPEQDGVDSVPSSNESATAESAIDPIPVPPTHGERDVVEQIEAFEESLAMSCPTCERGKVRVAVTEKGKMYYVCDNEECSFITWGKPYHFSCLYCQNPFLVEFYTPKGVMGLKCPKATCNYRQEYIGSPLLHHQTASPADMPANDPQGDAPPAKKKKKKVVRKKFVRRKR